MGRPNNFHGKNKTTTFFFLLRISMTSSNIFLETYFDLQLNFMWSLGYYTSPLIVTILYKKGFFVAESIPSLAKFSTGIGIIVVISLFMRGIGRFQNTTYVKFAKCLENVKLNNKNADSKKQIRLYDFEFSDWPVDFSISEVEE
jgi:hypothetical protein